MNTNEPDPRIKARAILDHISRETLRWGRMYDASKDATYRLDEICEAASIVLIELNEKADIKSADLTTLKRQLTAAKAGRAKAEKLTRELKAQVKELQDDVDDLHQQIRTGVVK